MTTLKNIVFGCVSDHGSETTAKLTRAPLDKPLPLQRVKFGLPLEEAFKDNILPTQLMDILVYIARDGVTTTDLFRRPGNPNDLKHIVKRLNDGRDIDYANYNFYTLASVIKKFLLKIPGGVFGPEAENELLNVLNIKEPIQQFDVINKIIRSLPKVSQELASMLFGTWFRMSHHSEFNSMSSESVAKSVAGSLFHTCADDPHMVNLASNVLQLLIENFAASTVFGRDNIEFFAQATRTRIDVLEKYKYELDTNFINVFGDVKDEDRNGLMFAKSGDIHSVEECLALFEKVVAHDAKTRGIDPVINAISSSQFCDNGILHHERITSSSNKFSNRISVVSSLPTPQLPKASETSSLPKSCQPVSKGREPQECISLSSYLSAPDVYESMEHHVPASEILTKSLSRVESVYRKQLLRLRQRNNWFLNCIPSSTSANPWFFPRINPIPCSIIDESSYMSSSFSCGILSSNVMANILKDESAKVLGDQNDTIKSSKISSSSFTTTFNSTFIPPSFSSSTNLGFKPLPLAIPVSKSANPKHPELNSVIPDLSISHVDLPISSHVLVKSPGEKGRSSIPIPTSTQASCPFNMPHTKYFHIQHHYGIANLEGNQENKSFEHHDSNSRC